MPSEIPPADLPQIVPPEEAEVAASTAQSSLAIDENKFIEEALAGHTVQAAALRNKLAQAYIDNLDADRAMRQTYAGRILKYLELYSAGVGALLLFEGFGKYVGFLLDKEVVTTLVGSTAVAAIGLVGFIARGLFRALPPPPIDGEKKT
jgi:hypothetical protein